jgi:hypothetical protein
MKKFFCVTVICLIFVFSGASPVRSQNQVIDEYAIINGPSGPQVCLGKWVPPTDIALPGSCVGQVVDIAQLTAVSSKESVVKLDQVLRVLVSIDERLALNNNQVARLVQAAVASQSSDEQRRLARDLLLDAISKRFDAMPKEITSADLLSKELAKLKQDILKEVEQLYSTRAGASGK